MKYFTKLTILTYFTLLLFLQTATALNTTTQVPDDYVKLSSQDVENKVIPSIESRMKELNTKNPDISGKLFSNGKIKISDGKVLWTDLNNNKHILASGKNLVKDHKISGFVIHKNSTHLAYYSTFNGQDLKYWYVVTISPKPKKLTLSPIINRMEGFTLSNNGKGAYYSYWNDKEAVKRNDKPIIEMRYREFGTDKDTLVFDFKHKENFAIEDFNNQKTLIAYRILFPVVGVKTTFSMYKGTLAKDGSYNWKKFYPRNKYIGLFLGSYDNQVYLLSSEAGNNYGVISVNVITGKRNIVVPSQENKVLHIAELSGDRLILQYHSIPRLDVSIQVKDLNGRKLLDKLIGKDFKLTSFGGLYRFRKEPGADIAYSTFGDVFNGNKIIKLNFDKENVFAEVLKSIEDFNFDASKVDQKFVQFQGHDGETLSGRLFYKKNTAPKFAFIRHYGWISVKNYPEAKEVQMALELGGAYLTLDIPGGGERGAAWFRKGSSERMTSIEYVSDASTFLQKNLNLPTEKIVALGRSWGGLTSLVLQAKFGHNFGVINAVAPDFDLEDSFLNSHFGRIAHSDFDPRIDQNGDYIFDDSFWNKIKSINPIRLINQFKPTAQLNIFTNGFDDRIDASNQVESSFVYEIDQKFPKNKLNYHRSTFNHSSRFYQALVFSILSENFDLKHEPLKLINN